ncbi:protein TIC 22, chloroplastic isoform X2 [Gastrolobium bilobum]|uniref:protein TIC 22, chloroplastic isoform X2 n=1 Tax=Gastrolobium bilobum TaxID=150636 RepID=UPI002AAF9747|nr:protein TIC 22, chloroplastic isoform X2 [Gastrolobium bilobum]
MGWCGQVNPLLSFSRFIHQHCVRLGTDIATRLEDTKRVVGTLAQAQAHPLFSLAHPKHALAATLSSQHVAKSLAGTSVYTVSNSNNEFVLISDADGAKSIGLLCFRQEDAEAFLAQVRSRKRELRSNARVVPLTLDQVYMLKVEGISFRFLPDPIQIKNALQLRPANKGGFDGVPVFQSDLLVVKKKNKRYCPVGSFEDVLRKMEMSETSSGWEDLIFIPPGKSHSQHIQEINPDANLS